MKSSTEHLLNRKEKLSVVDGHKVCLMQLRPDFEEANVGARAKHLF